jgi:hypothetical protein
MFNRKSALTACGAILGLALAASAFTAVSASQWGSYSRANHLTFSGPVGLPGVTLPAGTYIFELASQLSPDVVRVWNAQRTMVYLMAFTEEVARPGDWPDDRPVSFGEAPTGGAPPIRAWYPIGESTGRQFIYRSAR